jgi:antitoxin HigA-1
LKTTTRKAPRHSALPPVHPGEILKHDVLPAAGLSTTAAAKTLGISRQMLHGILAGRKPLSAVMCCKLARLFGGSPEVWIRLQAAYDLKKVQQDKEVMQRIARIVPVSAQPVSPGSATPPQ